VALKDLISDLSNFKGQSNYDGLDNQIEKGVDFFPNNSAGANGFTPKTNLESKYNKFMKDVRENNSLPNQYESQANILAPNSGLRINTNKLRLAYGTQGEYSEAEGVGISKISHILSNDNQTKRVQPQFLSDFMTTPIAEYNSQFSLSTPLGAGSKTLIVRKEAFRLVEGESQFDTYRSPFSVKTTLSNYDTSDYIKDLFEFKNGTFKNVPAGISNKGKPITKTFGEVADPNNFIGFTHPFILRETGNQWGFDSVNFDAKDTILEKIQKFTGGLGNVGDNILGDFVRGAPTFTGLLSRIGNDKIRIGKFIATPKGAGFIGKQFLLQALNPTIETKLYNPLSILSDTGIHISRHIPSLDYEAALKVTGPNGRLSFQSKAFGTADISTKIQIDSRPIKTGIGLIDNFFNNKIEKAIEKVQGTIDKSIFALSNPNRYSPFPSSAPQKVEKGSISFQGNLDLAESDLNKAKIKGRTFSDETAVMKKGETPTSKVKQHQVDNYPTLMSKARDESRESLYESNVKGKEINQNIGKENIGLEVIDNAELGRIKGTVKSSNVDKINIHPYGSKDLPKDKKDFIKFRFKDVVNNKFLVFRAILEGITDTITPEYGEERYIGRPDKIFTYQGADRNVSFTFSLYPKTKQELPILMEKLNYLVGLCYPSYTSEDRMITPFIELTMGDMFVNTPGIISSLTVTVEEQSTWEIDDKLQFPHFIKAACEFRHIGKYALATKGKHYDLDYLLANGLSENRNSTSDLGFNNYPKRSKKYINALYDKLGQG
tara:strand:- start:3015 stop:5336 length:2322 start_codon:yes stop_codon:yes gene_type:complete